MDEQAFPIRYVFPSWSQDLAFDGRIGIPNSVRFPILVPRPCFRWTNRHSQFGTFSHPSPNALLRWTNRHSQFGTFSHPSPKALLSMGRIGTITIRYVFPSWSQGLAFWMDELAFPIRYVLPSWSQGLAFYGRIPNSVRFPILVPRPCFRWTNEAFPIRYVFPS